MRKPIREAEVRQFLDDGGHASRLMVLRKGMFTFDQAAKMYAAGDVVIQFLFATFQAYKKDGVPDCLLCGAKQTAIPDVLYLMVPERPDPQNFISSPVCKKCAKKSDGEILDEGVKVITSLFTGGRVIDRGSLSPDKGTA